MNLTDSLLLILAIVLGSILTMPLVRTQSRLLQSQVTDLKSSVSSLSETQSALNQQMLQTIHSAISSQSSTTLTANLESQRILLEKLVNPLLSQQELLVNRLLARQPLDAQQLDASLVSREALKKEAEYQLQTDEAEAARLANLMGDDIDEINKDLNIAGFSSLDE